MNYTSQHQLASQRILSDQRQSHRYNVYHLLTITDRGTGQVIEISREGMSFGCLYPHHFPEQWQLDILDAHGAHIKNLRVRKIWQRDKSHPESTEKFEMEMGVQFIQLTGEQRREMDELLARVSPLQLTQILA